MVTSEQGHNIVAGSYQSDIRAMFEKVIQLTLTCPKSKIGTFKKGAKYIQILQQRLSDVFIVNFEHILHLFVGIYCDFEHINISLESSE